MLKKLSKGKKIALFIVIFFIIVAVGGIVTYRLTSMQGVVKDYTINEEITYPKLVIAAQQSKFKDEVVSQALEELKQLDVQILVTDVTKLSELEDSNWDGMVILTTV